MDEVERFIPDEEDNPVVDHTRVNANIKKVHVSSFQPEAMEDEEEFGGEEGFGDRGRTEGWIEDDRVMFAGADSDEESEEEAVKRGDKHGEEEDSEDDLDDEEEDDDDDVPAPAFEGMYDPSEFEHIVVPTEIKDLFGFIMRYTPQTIVVETRFKPFIPDYIPAVGDIDAFIKVGRGDEAKEALGLTVLDEPAAGQSDPSVLELQLRAVSKQTSAKAAKVRKIETSEKNSKALEKWINDISDLHRSKPPPTVHYQKSMPGIDTLMQEWPTEVEDLLKSSDLPTAQFDSDMMTYIDLMCSILDIPVHKNRLHSLHVLFTLYSAFNNSQHFNAISQTNENDDLHGLVGLVDRIER